MFISYVFSKSKLKSRSIIWIDCWLRLDRIKNICWSHSKSSDSVSNFWLFRYLFIDAIFFSISYPLAFNAFHFNLIENIYYFLSSCLFVLRRQKRIFNTKFIFPSINLLHSLTFYRVYLGRDGIFFSLFVLICIHRAHFST